jgi:hypothetical protein
MLMIKQVASSVPGGSAGKRLFGLALALMLVALVLSGHHGVAAEPTYEGCLAQTVVTLSGTYTQQVRYVSPAPGTTFDARNATFASYPTSTLYPFSIGRDSVPPSLCVLGGRVVGSQARSLTWDEMKTNYDGDALRLSGNDWYLADGLRVDNVEDGFAPRGTEDLYPKDGDGFTARNMYMTYIRDDCVENDDIAGGVVSDSLFDGCYTGISERPSSSSPQNGYPAPAGETLTLDHVLLRLEPMPGPYSTNDPNLLGHGQLFKWSPVANSLVIRDSIFVVEKQPNGGSADFPEGTIASNVTVVWLGGGAFPGKLPASGVQVVTDRSVWDTARARWLERHGCTSFDACSKLHTPDPYEGTSPTPTPTISATPTPTVSATPTPTVSATPTPTPTTASLTFGPAADATIRKKNATKNFGTAGKLTADGNPIIDSLIKFNVAGVGGRHVVKARLVLWCVTSSSGGGGTFASTGSSWNETSVTWNNAPAAGATIGSLGPVTAGRAYEVDLTALITGDGTYSLRVSLASAAAAEYGSRENQTSTMRPRLVLEVA